MQCATYSTQILYTTINIRSFYFTFSKLQLIKMAATTLYDGDGVVDFIKSSHEICELGCQCCIQLNSELQEAITELKSAMEITDILKDLLDIAYAND